MIFSNFLETLYATFLRWTTTVMRIGVASTMLVMQYPAAFSARIVDSRPGPRLTITSKFFGYSLAISPAPATELQTELTYEPRKPEPPAVAQASALP